MGFGWSFYGFFVLAVLWLAAYFVWAIGAAVRDRDKRRS
jgi:Na+-transporting methylmalonyl-CoA/oxaloacetate decarboxylase gamma subunit